MAHTAKDLSLLSEANVKLNEGRKIIESYSVQLDGFIKKFNIKLKKNVKNGVKSRLDPSGPPAGAPQQLVSLVLAVMKDQNGI